LNGIYEVGRWSQHAPRLILLEYRGNPTKKWRDIALVGKGVCFDAGGYNIKPTGGIETMKTDMTGAATAIGVRHYMTQMGEKKNIIIATPFVENLIAHHAYKPGDIITMYNGKTVEIANTDAEGRLILADTLSYVEKKYKPEHIRDIATLTWAQIVALGNKITAMMTHDDVMAEKIQTISRNILDRVWRLPLYKPYLEKYKSHIADIANAGMGGGAGPGCINAGLFLSEFIDNPHRIHFDIAGPSFSWQDPLTGHGATGCLLRLLIHTIMKK